MEGSSAVTAILSKVTFRDAIWLFPAAFTLHVLEEWPRFTNWAQRQLKATRRRILRKYRQISWTHTS